MKVTAYHYGGPAAHEVNDAWFSSLGVRSKPFNILSGKWATKLGMMNQLLAFFHSLFAPSADIYLLTSTGCVSTVLLKKKLFGGRIIVINSDTYYRDLTHARGLRRHYMAWLARQVDAMISTSELMKELASRHLDVPHEVVYPYCDVERFNKLKPAYNADTICSIGTGINTKGTDLLFTAFKQYHARHPQSALVVCGRKDFIAKQVVPEGAKLVGRVDPTPYLAAAGLYVNTSRHESFGVNIIEAMCSGLPTIVTDRCGAAEIVKQVDPALVVPLSVDAITDAMERYVDPAKRRISGKRARKIASNYTRLHSVERFRDAFSTLVRNVPN